jgi:signal transduction histidine kinase
VAFFTPRVPDTRRSQILTYVALVALSLAATLLGAEFTLPAFVFEHLMVVLVVAAAVVGGLGPAVATAVAGGIGDNVLLREPVGSPAIAGLRDVVDLVLFLMVAIVVGWLVDGLRKARAAALESAERERDAREALDRLVAIVSHDLATPLAAIQGTVQFARKNAALSGVNVGRLLIRIETAAARATSLLHALVETKSLERHSLALELRPVDFRTLVEQIATMLDCTSDRHPIMLAMESAPLVVHGDPERLGRVMENLISNAIKYSPGGGVIEIQLRGDDAHVTLSVRDHGVGIPPGARGRLFEQGYRGPNAAALAPGLGLGLYIAAEIIRLHGGTITVDPADGGGTMVTVRLPLAVHPELAGGMPGNDVRSRPASRSVH